MMMHYRPWKPCWKAVMAMASARWYGMKTSYTPNSKADKWSRINAYKRRRMVAEIERELSRQHARKLLDTKKGNGGEPCV